MMCVFQCTVRVLYNEACMGVFSFYLSLCLLLPGNHGAIGRAQSSSAAFVYSHVTIQELCMRVFVCKGCARGSSLKRSPMLSSGRLLRRRLVRALDFLLSLCLSLSALLLSGVSGRSLPQHSARRLDGRGVFGAVLGHRTKAQRDVCCFLVGAVAVLGGVGLVCLHLELTLFRAVDRFVCLTLSPLDAQSFPSAVASARVLSLPSQQVILRAVYLDPRPRDGFLNASVFLAEVPKTLLAGRGGVVACGAGRAVSSTLRVRVAKNSWWAHRTEPHLTHDVAMVDCYGLPSTPSGARAFLWYSLTDGGELYRVESEHPYFVPRPKQTQNRDDLKIVLCMAIVRDFPPFMREFLRYYKHLGVDHIYMTAEDSFVQNGILEADEFVREALVEGFVSFSFWHMWLDTDQVFYHAQMLAHQDCIYRFQGTYDYAFLMDSDDHFIPLVPERKTLDYYVELYCRFGACIFQWLEYFPDCGQDWSRLGRHGNVTNTLLSRTFHRRFGTGKTCYRLGAVLDAGTHIPQQLLQGYKYLYVPPDAAYVAHIRRDKHPPNGLQSC